jgi:hypothetical protein
MVTVFGIGIGLFLVMFHMAKPKIGSGALAASLRLGSKEISQILPALPDSVKVVEEPGALGNLTSVEVYQAKQPQQEPNKALDLEMGR